MRRPASQEGKKHNMHVEVGSVLEGKVTGIASFGTFVELPGGKMGLVHISEVSSAYVNDVKDHLKEGQKVKVKVIGAENGKISLSVKQVAENNIAKGEKTEKREKRSGRKHRAAQNRTDAAHRPPEEFNFGRRGGDLSFDDMLQKFKQDSDEKFQDLKRINDGKRSGGYRRSY